MSDGFAGFPVAALDFYDDLEVDNTRSFWEQHKGVYAEAVRAPMTALLGALVAEFAPDGRTFKVFRPYRDVRFAKDKTPYKTHQGAYIATAPNTGFYLELSPRGVRTGAGWFDPTPPRLAAFRGAVEHDLSGAVLAGLVEELRAAGWEIGGDQLKTTPRGYPADHPRIDLLRHKSLTASRSLGFDPVIHTAGLVDVVREDWRTLRPLVEWLGEYCEPRLEE